MSEPTSSSVAPAPLSSVLNAPQQSPTPTVGASAVALQAEDAAASHATTPAPAERISAPQPSTPPTRTLDHSMDAPTSSAIASEAIIRPGEPPDGPPFEAAPLAPLAPPPASFAPQASPSPSIEPLPSMERDETPALPSQALPLDASPSKADESATPAPPSVAVEPQESSHSPFVPTPSPIGPPLPAPPPLPTAPSTVMTMLLTNSGNAVAAITAAPEQANIAYEASEEAVRRRGLLWRDAAAHGVGGLANAAELHSALTTLDAPFPVPDLNKPASPAAYDEELAPVVKSFVFEDVASKFIYDEKSEELHDTSARAVADRTKNSQKAKGPFRYGTRTDDEDHLLMEQRELTLDDINLTLIIHGIDKKRGEAMCRKGLLEFFKEQWNIQPQALSRFNRREEFWKVIFNSSDEAKSLAGITVDIHYPQTVSFVRPVMYRMLMNDPGVQVSAESRDDLLRRSRIIVGNNDKKRKAHPLSDQFEVGDVPSKRRRVELEEPSAPAKKATPAKNGRGRRGRTPKKSPTPLPTLRDDPTVSVPDTTHLIPYSPDVSYNDEDMKLLQDVAVILRARRMPQDQSIWFLCGPLSARVNSEEVRDVMWVEAPVLYARCPALTCAFFEKIVNWSNGELFAETVTSGNADTRGPNSGNVIALDEKSTDKEGEKDAEMKNVKEKLQESVEQGEDAERRREDSVSLENLGEKKELEGQGEVGEGEEERRETGEVDPMDLDA